MTRDRANSALRRFVIAGVLIAGTLLTARRAAAQEVLLSDGQVRANPLLPESKGIKVGEGRLHPFGEVDSHAIYNPGRFTSAAYGVPGGPSESARNDFYFVLRPGLDYRLPSPHLELGAIAYIERQQYIENTAYSSFQGGLGGNLLFNKDGPLQLRATERLTRGAMPGNQTFTQRFNHWTNNTGAGVDFEPGGGALKLTADLSFFADIYDESSQLSPQILNNQRYTPTLRAAWSFLPKTQLFAEATATRANFGDGQGVLTNADSWLYSGFAGMNGAILPKLTVMVRLGYSGISTGQATGLDRQQSTVGVQAEANWTPTVLTKVRIGGLHQIEPVSVFVYADTWKGYLRFDQALATRINVSVGLEYFHLDYARDVAGLGSTSDGSNKRHDDNLQTSVTVAYYLTEFVTLSLVDRLDLRGTNYQYAQIDGQPDLSAGYRLHDVFLRIGVRY